MCQLSLVVAFGIRDLSSLIGDGNSVLSIGRQILKFLTHLTTGKSPKEDFRYVAFMTLAMSPKTHWQACGCLFRGLRPRTKAPETRRCCLSFCLSVFGVACFLCSAKFWSYDSSVSSSGLFFLFFQACGRRWLPLASGFTCRL